MKTFKDLEQKIEGIELIMKVTANDDAFFRREVNRRYNFIFWTVVAFYVILGITIGILIGRVANLEKQVEQVNKEAIYGKDLAGDAYIWARDNSVDIDQLVCELRESGHIDKGWTCQLYDEHE